MKNRMEDFLNSDEFKSWQNLFWKIYFEKRDESFDMDELEELLRDFETQHLITSIRLSSAYPKER